MAAIGRLRETTPELEARELLWWQTFAELENRFAWVQTPALQRVLRGHYVRRIVSAAGAGGSILDLGCGAGWLSLVLAAAGAVKVTGVDFSSAQIDIANKNKFALGVGDEVAFKCLDATAPDRQSDQYDCVVIHAFLHHLSTSEITKSLSQVPKLLKPHGKLVVLEPVFSGSGAQSAAHSKWLYRLQRLRSLANTGIRFGIRKVSEEESRWREAFSSRNWGKPPFGPSPKETPFAPGELESYMSDSFVVEDRRAVMALSHLACQEWLLRGVSHPISTGLLLPIVSRLAALGDRKLLEAPTPPPDLWIFTLFTCRLH